MQPTDVIERWVEAFNDADPSRVVALYAEKATLHVVFAEPLEGKEAIKALFTAYFGSGKLHCIVQKMHCAGEWAIMEWLDANGLPGVNIYRVVGGLIVTQRNYFDQLSYFRRMGIPQPQS